ncbi:MAG: hypothetical protein JW850_24260 [Thermoflexales bacterium]|nr:hypothetical protein [Thermoflexales bacterium]
MVTKIRVYKTGFVLIALGIACFALASCGGGGETNQDLVTRFKPQYAEMRAKLQQVAEKIPERANGQKVTQSLSPQPQYTYGADTPANTDIMMYPHLIDPNENLHLDQLDMAWGSSLQRALQYTGEKSSLTTTALKNKASESIQRTLEGGLQTRYLAVAKVLAYQPVTAVSKDSFKGGSAQVDGYLVDLESQQILCSFSVSARPQEHIDYKYKEGDNPTVALARWANSSLESNARAAFIEALNEFCGGNFSLGK